MAKRRTEKADAKCTADKKVHVTDPYIINPPHKLTVYLIGCGGNGARMAVQLARMDYILRNLGHPGLFVKVFDPKNITEASISRQQFAMSDVGQNKASLIVTRINRMFSQAWEAKQTIWRGEPANLLITCVDNAMGRIEVAGYKSRVWRNERDLHLRPIYWLDLGNGEHNGQFVLGTLCLNKDLRCVDDIFPEILEKHEDLPSCSVMESISRQSPFINHILTDMACMMLYDMIVNMETDYHGMIINIKENIYNKILV